MNKLLNKFLAVGAFAACLFAGCSSDDSNDNDSLYAINGFSPAEAFSGDQVTITGSGFDEEVDVYFNEAKAVEYVSRSSNQIVVTVPANAATGRICVLGKGGYAFSKESFTYIPGAEITSITPLSAAPGDQISILGINFHAVALEDLKVYFNDTEGEVVSASSERIDAVVPEGATTGPITVVFGNIQRITGPELVIGEKEPDPFTYYFSHHDVVEISGACNPCSYADTEWKTLIGERDKSASEYIFKYSDGYDANTPVGSFVLWDSQPGNYTIFKVNVLEPDDYYIYFGTKGKGTGNITISAGSDTSNLGEGITNETTSSGYSSWNGPYEYGPYSLGIGTNYVRIDFEVGLALNDIRVTNVREAE